MIAPKQHASDAKPKDAELARTISAKVQGLPLALAQAGAYVEKTRCGLAGYMELLIKRFAEVMSEVGGTDIRHRPVTATFSLSLEQLAQTNKGAVELMSAAAFLPPDAIPEEIFTEGAKQFTEPLQTTALDAIAWDKAIAAALGFSLLERNQDDKTLAVHRMVQEVVKSRMSAGERAQWAEQVVRAVNKVFPNPEFAVWGKCERLVPSAQSCMALVDEYGLSSSEAARVLNQAGYYLDDRARYAEAEPLYRRALAIDEKALGSDHPNVAIRLNNLAELLRVTNRPGEAEPLTRRALAIDEKALGPDHPSVAIRFNNLARLLQDTNRLGEAEPLYRRALAIWESALGAEHPQVATGLNNLALLLKATNRLNEAELLMRRALAIDEKAYAPDHPDVAIDLNNLARLLQDTNRLGEAEPRMRQALAIFEKSLGRDHPNTVTVRENLAGLLREMGRDDEADKL